MPQYDFPADLVAASAACRTLAEQIEAFPLRPVVLADGTVVRSGDEYTELMDQELQRLQGERLAQATAVVTHDFWETVEAGDRWAARSALKHVG